MLVLKPRQEAQKLDMVELCLLMQSYVLGLGKHSVKLRKNWGKVKSYRVFSVGLYEQQTSYQ